MQKILFVEAFLNQLNQMQTECNPCAQKEKQDFQPVHKENRLSFLEKFHRKQKKSAMFPQNKNSLKNAQKDNGAFRAECFAQNSGRNIFYFSEVFLRTLLTLLNFLRKSCAFLNSLTQKQLSSILKLR